MLSVVNDTVSVIGYLCLDHCRLLFSDKITIMTNAVYSGTRITIQKRTFVFFRSQPTIVYVSLPTPNLVWSKINKYPRDCLECVNKKSLMQANVIVKVCSSFSFLNILAFSNSGYDSITWKSALNLTDVKSSIRANFTNKSQSIIAFLTNGSTTTHAYSNPIFPSLKCRYTC